MRGAFAAMFVTNSSLRGAVKPRFMNRKGPIEKHLISHLGKPFAVIAEPVLDDEKVEVAGFAETPGDGIITMATCGLADLARRHHFAGNGGAAQELVMVLDGKYLTDDFLEFFFSMATAYVQQHRLLAWDEAIRLGMAIPGSEDMTWVHPWPTVFFEDSFQFVTTSSGETCMCLMIPMREQEAVAATKIDIEVLGIRMDQLQPEVWALDRPMLDFGH